MAREKSFPEASVEIAPGNATDWTSLDPLANHEWVRGQGDRPLLAQMSTVWPKDMRILIGVHHNHMLGIEEARSTQKRDFLLDNKKENKHYVQ